ncbi:MAG: alanine:cation symporter family protein [Deltaproteobacteria bacterium]|nr:alanine:cation symporter family protein [Deltaproteobacteria bacterium]MBW2359351.1 alanine:cation symporter family protein [Deltaproteobacteria bacterium]
MTRSTRQHVSAVLLAALAGTLLALPATAGIDEQIDAAVRPLTDAFASVVFFKVDVLGAKIPLVVAWLIGGGLFFTLYFRFISIRGFAHAIRIVRGDYDDARAPGEVSHFQALCTAVSGTVGIGNIGGVAIAISLGGPGATFWMIVAGVLGMTTKLVECTLAVLHRDHHPDGSVSGGPMYYLQKGIEERYSRRAGKAIGSFYALGIVIGCLGIGNMFQSNQAFVQFVQVTGGPEASWFAERGWLFGIITAAVVGSVIIGGIRVIARVTERVVPFMAVFYIAGCLLVIGLNYQVLPLALQAIVSGAFQPEGVAGGMLGVMVLGFQRAVFSNEAGIGSAAIAHAAVRTEEPATEGFVSLLEPFIDTVVICTLTALVLVTAMVADPSFAATDLAGIEMTSAAFERSVAWAPYPLAVAAILFAVSTMFAWAYYGLKAWTYLVGDARWATLGFNAAFCGFAALGCMIRIDAVLDFSDALVFVVCVPNILGMLLLAPVVRERVTAYQARLQQGEIGVPRSDTR